MAMIVALVTARSASAQIAVTGDLIVERFAAPGETYKGAITIRNTTETVQVAVLSLADYRFDANGSNWFDPPGSHARSNTGWIALSQQAVSLPPQGTQVVSYTVTVPASTPRPLGTYWSVVLVEVEPRGEVAAGPSTFVITPRTRYAVQLATQVVGEARECRLTFAEPHVKPGEFAIDITDVEIRACRPKLRLEVYDADGALVHTATLRGSFLYPATSARQRFGLPALVPGGYSFLLMADVGADTLQGARFQIQVR
jgi:hypothetical protein